jgi:hypothetical protein
MCLINKLGINRVPKEKNKNNTFQNFGRYYFKLKSTILDMRIFKIVYELKKSTKEEYTGISSEVAIYSSLRHRKIFHRVLAICRGILVIYAMGMA